MTQNIFQFAGATAALFSVPLILIGSGGEPATLLAPAETIRVASARVNYPQPGEYLAAGKPIEPPVEMLEIAEFRIMKHQVGLADYGRCVEAGACDAPDARATAGDVPVTGVNWDDAEAYARWYTRATGKSWRLPTAEEAMAAGAERFTGEAFSAVADDPGNPAVRWLRQYREEAASKRPVDPKPRPLGSFGPNSLGVEDFAGNVWEWTSTCYKRVTVEEATGRVLEAVENCGVRVLEGKHRAYMSSFVRDGKSGGCAVGTPPENLGFRLVHSDGDNLVTAARQKFRRVAAFLRMASA